MKLYTNGTVTYALSDKNQIDAFLQSGFHEIEKVEKPKMEDVTEAPSKRGRKTQAK